MCKMKLEPGSPIESNWSYLLKHDVIPSYPVIRPLFSRPRAPYCIDTTWSASTATWPNARNSEGMWKSPVIYRFLSIIYQSFESFGIGVAWFWLQCLCGFVQLSFQAWEVALLVPMAFLAILRRGSDQTEQLAVGKRENPCEFGGIDTWRQCDWGLLSRWCRLGSYRSQARKPNRW